MIRSSSTGEMSNVSPSRNPERPLKRSASASQLQENLGDRISSSQRNAEYDLFEPAPKRLRRSQATLRLAERMQGLSLAAKRAAMPDPEFEASLFEPSQKRMRRDPGHISHPDHLIQFADLRESSPSTAGSDYGLAGQGVEDFFVDIREQLHADRLAMIGHAPSSSPQCERAPSPDPIYPHEQMPEDEIAQNVARYFELTDAHRRACDAPCASSGPTYDLHVARVQHTAARAEAMKAALIDSGVDPAFLE